MRSLVLLLLTVGAAWADSDCEGGPAGLAGMGLASARVDSHQIRLNTLEDQIEKLAERAEDASHSNVGQAARNLEARIKKLEGTGCHGNEFQCGGDRRHCLSDLLVCDGDDDCGNNADESEDTCKVRCPAGSSWEGDVFWSSCKIFKDQKLRLIITGNRRVNYFQPRVWVSGVLTFEYQENGHPVTKTVNSQGQYNFAKRRLALLPPKGATDLAAGLVCNFVSDDAADCTLTQVSDLNTCARVRLNKK